MSRLSTHADRNSAAPTSAYSHNPSVTPWYLAELVAAKLKKFGVGNAARRELAAAGLMVPLQVASLITETLAGASEFALLAT